MKSPSIPFGFITELETEELKSFKPTYFLVMGKQQKDGFKPMTFNYESGVFCWSYPSEDASFTDEVGELYNRETAMKLIAHHVINSGSSTILKLFPVHIPFTNTANCKGYKNPYLNEVASTELVRKLNSDYIDREGELGCDYHMPASLGGEYIATGQCPKD